VLISLDNALSTLRLKEQHPWEVPRFVANCQCWAVISLIRRLGMKRLPHERASIDTWWLEERSKVVNSMLTRMKLSDISPGPLGSLPDCSAQ
jgi:hypothetical protein